jgi:beta-lactamase regulating signal transducer with metallopeptidase domain
MTANNHENENNLILVAIILALFFAIVLTSCSSRKVQKSETKETEKTEIKTEEKTETKLTDNTKIVDTSTTDEIEIVPVDNTLPFTINGKEYKNVKIRHKKSRNNITINKDVKVHHNAQKSGLKTVKRDLIIERKVIDRKQSFWWLLWFLLLIPAYYLWRKYKGYFI